MCLCVALVAKMVCGVQQVNLLVQDKGREAAFPEILVVLPVLEF